MFADDKRRLIEQDTADLLKYSSIHYETFFKLLISKSSCTHFIKDRSCLHTTGITEKYLTAYPEIVLGKQNTTYFTLPHAFMLLHKNVITQ